MPAEKINSINLYYEQHGSGEPLVLIAGFGADHQTWRLVLDGLKEKYRVIIFDNRGAGQSDVPKKPYTIEDMADDVSSLCAHLKIPAAHFIGSSMGGCILQVLAYKYPALVRSAILSNATFAMNSCFNIFLGAQLELLKAQAPMMPLIKSSFCWVYSYQFLQKEGVLDALALLIMENSHPFTIAGFEGQFAALQKFNSTSYVKKITAPVLVVGADEDIIFSTTVAKALVEHIPGAQYYEFQQCGHLPFVEHPLKFIDVVNSFVSRYLGG